MTPQLSRALTRYRVMAYIVGVMLLILVTARVAKYGFGVADATKYVAVAHGWLYMIYVLVALDLVLRMRWSFGRIVFVVISGTIPFVSFFCERKVVNWVHAEKGTQVPASA